MGINVNPPELDLPAMLAYKQEGIDGNVKGVEFLLKKNKVTTFFGTGSIPGAGRVTITSDAGDIQSIEATNIVIATGSDVAQLPALRSTKNVLSRRPAG